MQRMLIIVHSLYYDELHRCSAAVDWFCGLVRNEEEQFCIECDLKRKLRATLLPSDVGKKSGEKPLGIIEHRVQSHPLSAQLSVV